MERVGLSDAHLAKRWRDGDSEAAAILFERYRRALAAVAYGIVADAGLAQDVVQETFVRAAGSIHRLNGAERIGPYLVTIARRAAIDVRRRRRRETALDAAPDLGQSKMARDANRSELDDRLNKAVASLPDHQREVFLMKYVSGMTYREIGTALGLSEEAVGQKLWRVRQKLQAMLEDLRP